MKRIIYAGCAGVALAFAGTSFAESRDLPLNEVLPLEQILDTLQKQQQGKVVEAELEREGERVVWDIELIDDQMVKHELEFNALTGELLNVEGIAKRAR